MPIWWIVQASFLVVAVAVPSSISPAAKAPGESVTFRSIVREDDSSRSSVLAACTPA